MTLQPRSIEPKPEVLEANRLRLVLDLATRLRAFECRFGFETSDLEAALLTGRLVETSDVSDWLIGYRTLSAVIGSRSTSGD
jgi:hypothetical protein